MRASDWIRQIHDCSLVAASCWCFLDGVVVKGLPIAVYIAFRKMSVSCTYSIVFDGAVVFRGCVDGAVGRRSCLYDGGDRRGGFDDDANGIRRGCLNDDSVDGFRRVLFDDVGCVEIRRGSGDDGGFNQHG